ncbi:MAG: hypothetical protein AB7I27_09780 [Bacteriovoracaceae bacterium]
MGLVLWIDQNTFASNLVERVFKKKDLPFYTISQVNDFLYLVKDLNPEVLVLDASTALSSLDAFRSQYLLMEKIPLIVLDPKDGLDFLENKIGEIKRPFDPFEIPGQISNLLKNN